MRRGVVTAVLLVSVLAASPPRAAQEPPSPALPSPDMLTVLDPEPEGPRITPYLRYQLERGWDQDEARRAAFAAVRTRADLTALQEATRRKVLDIIGGLPAQRTPLNARITGALTMDGYRIEKLVFESLPGLHVTALVYVPEGGTGRRPAVLLACGHSPIGKAHPPYQEIAGRLARRGYVVLCWDPVGQGERSQFWDAGRGRSRYNLVCGEHAVLGNLATLAGLSLVRWMVWDGMRALDYLLTRPEVDQGRISITGTSGGGFQSLYVGALDPRVKVVAPSCFVTALPMRMANRIFEDPDSDPEQDPYRLVSAGVDHAGLLLLAFPRPVFVAAAVQDFFPIEGTRKTFREVAALYRAFDATDRIGVAEGYHRHQYSSENQAAAFAFLDRFNAMPPRRGLDAVRTLPPEELRCTRSGQVRLDLPGRSLVELIREAAGERAPAAAPRLADLYYGELYPGIRGWPVVRYDGLPRTGAIAWEEAGSSRAGALVIDRYRLHHSDGLVMPLLHVHGDGPRSRRLVLDLGYQGKVRPSDWGAIRTHLDEGWEVVSFDLRGLGETRMRYQAAPDDPERARMDPERAYASPISGVLANHVYNALLTGRPYFFEMIEDAEIAARFARVRLGGARLAVSGRGEAETLAAAVAAVLPGVERRGGAPDALSVWERIVVEGREVWPIHDLLPGGAHLRP